MGETECRVMAYHTKILALAIASCLLCLAAAMGPPPGPNNIALCPVTGINMTITYQTPVVHFTNGQVLYFSTEQAASKYRDSPRDYWLSPHDLPGETRNCPYSNETFTIDMPTPRVFHKHGQSLYFCCFGCISSFWTDPSTAILK